MRSFRSSPLTFWRALLLGSAALGACSGPGASETGRSSQEAKPIEPLPYAQGREFDTLDAYLAHLRSLSAIDVPYYEEVAPGVYERRTGRRPPGAPPPERLTRGELARRYGFAEGEE